MKITEDNYLTRRGHLRYLESVNITTLRFTNYEVLNNFDSVLKRLLPFLRGDVPKGQRGLKQ